MEALALLFAIGVFVALFIPEAKPKPKSAGDKLVEGLKAVAVELKSEVAKPSSKPAKPQNFWASPWAVMLYTILLGILLTTL